MFSRKIFKVRIIAVAIASMLFMQGASYAQSKLIGNNFSSVPLEAGMAAKRADGCSNGRAARVNGSCEEDEVSAELSALGARGELIEHARGRVLQILQGENGCAAWFKESDPDAAEVFRSLHFDLDRGGISYIQRSRDKYGAGYYKHPWGAKTSQDAGSGSTISINDNGAFFRRQSRVTDATGGPRGAWKTLTIGLYEGDTREVRVTIMLHELGHVIGRIPRDSEAWSQQSSENTLEVLRHCQKEIETSTRRSSAFGD
jgi:hypothetical protein